MEAKHIADHQGIGVRKHFKDTLFRTDRLLLGVNCLEPGQAQLPHVHSDQDKAYVVQEGVGTFTVADQERELGVGAVVWAPAGELHGVRNDGSDRLVLLVVIAPAPGR